MYHVAHGFEAFPTQAHAVKPRRDGFWDVLQTTHEPVAIWTGPARLVQFGSLPVLCFPSALLAWGPSSSEVTRRSSARGVLVLAQDQS